MSDATARVDPITLEVIRNRLDMIAEEMQTTLLRASYSSIVKEAHDASSALFDSHGDTVAQASASPSHLGMLIPAVKRILREFPAMQPGDIYIFNDPHDGGTHLPDITVVMPIFYEGEPVSMACTMTHHQDVGGKSPGSTPPDATEIFAEGIVIPPLKLYDRGQLNEGLLKLLRRNVRMPDYFTGDIMAQVACCKTGDRRIRGLFAEYGKARTLRYYEELMDHAERLSRAITESIPDGRYSFFDYVDSNGVDPHAPVKIQASVEVRGSDLFVDYTGTDPQAKGGINCVFAAGQAGVYFVVRAVGGREIPNNAGSYRPVKLHMPLGTVVNAAFPAAVGARATTHRRLAQTVQGALARAIPHRIPAAAEGCVSMLYVGGLDPKTGRRYVAQIAVPNVGGSGARPDRDGLDVICTDNANFARTPAEAFEQDFPFRLHECDTWTDSGGPGRWRGGLGFHAIVELLRGETPVTMRRERQDFAPWGLYGGKAAPRNRTIIHRGDGRVEEMPSMVMTQMAAGDRLELFTTGGGGHGDPLEREPWRVREDVLDKAVSVDAAQRDYGVVLVGRGPEVDEAATDALRSEKRASRGPVTWTFDRGDGFTARTGLPQLE